MATPFTGLIDPSMLQLSREEILRRAQQWIHTASFHYCYLSFLSKQFPRLCVPGLGAKRHDVTVLVTVDDRYKLKSLQVDIDRDSMEKLDSCRVAYNAARVLHGSDHNAIAVVLISMEVQKPDTSSSFHLMSLLFNNVTKEYYFFEPLGQKQDLTFTREQIRDEFIERLRTAGYKELADYTFVPIHNVCMIQKYARESTLLQEIDDAVEDYIQENLTGKPAVAETLRDAVNTLGEYMAILGNCDVWNLIFIHSVLAHPNLTVRQVAEQLTTLLRMGSKAEVASMVEQLLLEVKVYMAMAQEKCTKVAAKPESQAKWCFEMACKVYQQERITSADVAAVAKKVRQKTDTILDLMALGLEKWQAKMKSPRQRRPTARQFLELILPSS